MYVNEMTRFDAFQSLGKTLFPSRSENLAPHGEVWH
jgi:hypothetical protein